MTVLYDQPTKAPTRKVKFAGLGVPLATIFAGLLSATQMPYIERLFAYPGFEAGLGAVIAFLMAYMAKDQA